MKMSKAKSFVISLALFVMSCSSTNAFALRSDAVTWHHNVRAAMVSSGPNAAAALGLTHAQRTTTNLIQLSSPYEIPVRRQRGFELEIPPIVHKYIDQCNRRPFLTKGITAGIVAGTGDMVSQVFFSGVHFSFSRFFSFVLLGMLYNGPVVHVWYELLWKVGKFMEEKRGSSKKVQTLAQIVLDQTIGVSFLYPGYFYAFELLESLVSMRMPNLAQAHFKCTQQIVSILVMSLRLWPFVNWVNFTVVPAPLRVLFANLVAVFWNIFLFAKVA